MLGEISKIYMENPAAQTVGFVAIFVGASSYQVKTQRGILAVQSVSCSLWSLHFFLLGAVTGGLLNGAMVFRNLIYGFGNKTALRFAPHVIAACVLLSGIYGTFWGEGKLYCLLAPAAQVLQTYLFLSKDAQKIRKYSLVVSALWFAYNTLSSSLAGIAGEIVNIISIIAGYVRYMGKKTAKEI